MIYVEKFVRESNMIENIMRDPTKEEVSEFIRFMSLHEITIEELLKFLSVYEPTAVLREEYGLNVKVRSKEGLYVPPFSGPHIREELNKLLTSKFSPFKTHVAYERLHPFTDGNGRTGRALWAWKQKDISDGFLLRYYFQSLREV